MTVDGIRDVRSASGQMDHRRGRYSQLPITMHSNAEIECLADSNHFAILMKSPPKMQVGQNYVDTAHSNPRRKLLPSHEAHVGGQWNWHRSAHLTHTFQRHRRILKVF